VVAKPAKPQKPEKPQLSHKERVLNDLARKAAKKRAKAKPRSRLKMAAHPQPGNVNAA
jgi:hypothetical protein